MLNYEKMFSVLVGCKNNFEYTKHFYTTTRNIYRDVEIVFVSYGSTDPTNSYLSLLDEIDPNVRVYLSDETKTLSDTYNKAATIANNEYIVFCHNDLVLGPGFLESLSKKVCTGRVVTYTTFEPPGDHAWHQRPGKHVIDFGKDLESFNYVEFIQQCNKVHYKSLEGWAFFMTMSKKEYLKLGGLDNRFAPAFCEDDDLYIRLLANKFEFIVDSNARSYHFVSKTSRSDKVDNNELINNLRFVEKWRFRSSIYGITRPIRLVITSATLEEIQLLDSIYIFLLFDDILINETPNHEFLKSCKNLRSYNESDIKYELIISDINSVTNSQLNQLWQLQDTITFTNPSPGLYQYSDNVKLKVL